MAFGGPFFGQAAGRTFERFRSEDRENRGLDIQQQNADTQLLGLQARQETAELKRASDLAQESTKKLVGLMHLQEIGHKISQTKMFPEMLAKARQNVVNSYSAIGQQVNPDALFAAAQGQQALSASAAGAKTAAQEDAKTRTVQVRAPNGDVVDILIDSEGNTIRELGRGPNRIIQEEGVPPLSQKDITQLDTQENNVAAFGRTAKATIDLIKQGGPAVLSGSAQFTSSIQSLRTTAEGIAQLAGVDVNKFDDGKAALNRDNKAELIFQDMNLSERLEVSASQVARIKSNITELAFAAAAASGQTGKSVSDKDFERFVRRLGAGATSPETFASVLRDVAAELNAKFQTNFKIKQRRNKALAGQPIPNPLEGVFNEVSAGTRENPARPTTQVEFDALPSGAFFVDDEGLKVKP